MKTQLVREELLQLMTVTFEKPLLKKSIFFLNEYILLSQTNNTSGWSWRLGWDGECNKITRVTIIVFHYGLSVL
jgi:hypothetical protein